MSKQKDTLIQQVEKELAKRNEKLTDITVTQELKTTVYLKGLRFGKYPVTFSVDKTPTGKVKSRSVWFCNQMENN